MSLLSSRQFSSVTSVAKLVGCEAKMIQPWAAQFYITLIFDKRKESIVLSQKLHPKRSTQAKKLQAQKALLSRGGKSFSFICWMINWDETIPHNVSRRMLLWLSGLRVDLHLYSNHMIMDGTQRSHDSVYSAHALRLQTECVTFVFKQKPWTQRLIWPNISHITGTVKKIINAYKKSLIFQKVWWHQYHHYNEIRRERKKRMRLQEDFGPKPVTCSCETQIIQANATNVRSTETDVSFP